MTGHPTRPLAAEGVVNLDGTGTWSIRGGPAETISATTAAAARDTLLRRAVVAAAERGTSIELTATFAGVPTVLGISPTGEIARIDPATIAPRLATAPGDSSSSEAVNDAPVPEDGTEPRPGTPWPWARAVSRTRTAVAGALRSHVAIAAAAGVMAGALVAGVGLLRGVEGGSPIPAAAPVARPAAPTHAAGTSTSPVVPAAARAELDVTVRAAKGGPLTAHVQTTARPAVATLTIWRGERRIATRRLHLTVARATWSLGTVTFTHTGPGRYRWVATAPGAARVTGSYTVLVNPAPPQPRVQPSTRPVTVAATLPASRAPAPSAPASPRSATPRPSSAPPPAPTPQTAAHDGPVPGGSTSPPHTGPRP